MSDITTKQSGAVANPMEAGAWDVKPSVNKHDLLISRLLMMQGMSEQVTDGDAKIGEIRDSVTGELYAEPEGQIEVIPFFCQKFWRKMAKKDANGNPLKKLEHVEKFPVIDDPTDPNYNADLEWENEDYKHNYTYEFFVLLPNATMPKIVSFSRTSANAGKKIFNQMYILNAEEQLPPPAYYMILSGKKVKGDDGTYVVWEAKRGDRASEAEVAVAFKYYQQVVQGAVRVHEEE